MTFITYIVIKGQRFPYASTNKETGKRDWKPYLFLHDAETEMGRVGKFWLEGVRKG